SGAAQRLGGGGRARLLATGANGPVGSREAAGRVALDRYRNAGGIAPIAGLRYGACFSSGRRLNYNGPMHRQPLFDLLSRYQRDFPEELQTVLRIRQLVASREDCFLRTCRPGHVTGSAWVVSPDRRRCLLVHHAKLDRWLQPGG